MNYFRVHRAEKVFLEYVKLVKQSWNIIPESTIEDDTTGDFEEDPPLNAEGRALQQSLHEMFPVVRLIIRDLSMDGIVDADRVLSEIGPYSVVSSTARARRVISSEIHQTIGAIKATKQRAFCRLVIPLYWLIDIPAFVLRLPFVILRRAGLPAEVEQSVVSHIIKIMLLALILLVIASFGLKSEIASVVQWFGK